MAIEEETGRNLVLCFDGTGDWIATGFTNVAKIYDWLTDENQEAFYDGGIGTLSDMAEIGAANRTFLRALDLATATGLGDKVLRGYLFLVRNYRKGDRIYMFGFSRGAYTARVLASLIHNFGILKKDCEHIAPYIWQAMSQISLSKTDKKDRSPTADHDDKGLGDEPTTSIGKFKRTASVIKETFSLPEAVEIHFMGLFDTVSSVGVIGRFATFPNTDKNHSVRRVCHAVAIDEQRNAFPESLFHPQQRGLTEVWFPGVHRDVGGGKPFAESGISDRALDWVLGEAEGLRYEQPVSVFAAPKVVIPDRDVYVVLGLYPMLMFSKQVSGYRYLWPNFRHLRVVPENALVHQVVKSLPVGYAPENLPPGLPYKLFDPKDPAVGPERNEVFDPSGGPAGPIADFAMCVYGGAVLATVWSALIGTPFGPLWPVERLGIFPFGWLVALAAVGVGLLLSRGPAKYQGAALQKGKIAFSAGSLLLALGLFFAFPNWRLAMGGAGLGAVLWGIARFPGLPPMRAVRALPYLLRSVSGSFVASLGVAILFSLLSWLLLGFQWIKGPLGFEYAGLSHLQWGAVVALIILFGRNVFNLLTDRKMMIRPSADISPLRSLR